MAYSARPARSPYSEEEAVIVQQAKRTHRETTESAERALKTANRTKELAANTLEELQQQGDQLERIDRDLHTIDADIKESKGLLNYMQRCCLCFLCSCCCDCDPSVNEDKTRKSRVKAQRQERSDFKGMLQENRSNANGFPLDHKEPEAEEDARGQLFQTQADSQRSKQAARSRNSAYNIGKDLAEPDRLEVQKDTERQEKALDAIGSALDDLKLMGNAMHDEIGRQEDVLNRVERHTDGAQDGLTAVQQSAEKTLGKKGTRNVHRKYMPSQTKVASHIASAARKF